MAAAIVAQVYLFLAATKAFARRDKFIYRAFIDGVRSKYVYDILALKTLRNQVLT